MNQPQLVFHARRADGQDLGVAVEAQQVHRRRQVREDRGLVYGISFSVKQYERFFAHGLAVVHLNPKPDKVQATLAEVHRVLRDVLAGNISPQELQVRRRLRPSSCGPAVGRSGALASVGRRIPYLS